MGKITKEINMELDLASYSIEGELTFAELRDEIEKYYQGTLTKYTLWDFSNAEISKYFMGDEANKIGEIVGKLGKKRPGCFDLIVVSDMLKYGLARVYSVYAGITQKGADELQPLVFREKDSALKWLRVNEATNKK